MKKRRSSVRRIIGDILLALALLLLAEVLCVMPAKINGAVLKANYQSIFHHQLIICGVLLVLALDIRFSLFARWKPAVLKFIGWGLRAAVVLAGAVIIYYCGKVTVGGLINTAGQADYAVVLGLALENGQPVPGLLSRLNTAKGYLEKYPEAKLILTGGNADEQGRTEAAVMRDVLMGQGVSESKLILEDQAKSTKENFRNISGMIAKDEPVVMISSDYHMDRAVRIAEKEGFTRLMRLPAPSGFFSYGVDMLSEVVVNLNELTRGRAQTGRPAGQQSVDTAEQPGETADGAAGAGGPEQTAGNE